MKTFNLEINEDELNLIRIALSCTVNDLNSTRVKIDPKSFRLDEPTPPHPFAKQEKELLDLDKRLNELKKS